MRKYEITAVISGKLGEDEQLSVVDDIRGIIATAGGTVEAERPWGKRNLQYPIDKQSTGYYQTLVVTLPSERSEAATMQLEQLPTVLRFLFTHFVPQPAKVIGKGERPTPAIEAAPVAAEAAPVDGVVRQEKLDVALEEILKES